MGAHGRPYWLHQVAEYIVGLVLLLLMITGRRRCELPLLVAGGVARACSTSAISGPPAGCVHVVSRPVHKWTDVGVVAALVAIPIVFHDRATTHGVGHDDRLRGRAARRPADDELHGRSRKREPMPPDSRDIAKASPRALGPRIGEGATTPASTLNPLPL